jgi:Flp pilus assembly pilin Flp
MRRRLKQKLSSIRKLVICTAAATAIEYGLIASGIAVAIIPATQLAGVNLLAVFTTLASMGSEEDGWPAGVSVSFDNGVATLSGDGVIDTAAFLARMAGQNIYEIEIASGSPTFNLTLTAQDIASITGEPLGMSNGLSIYNGSGGATVNATLTPPAGGSVTPPMFGVQNILDSSSHVQGSFRIY